MLQAHSIVWHYLWAAPNVYLLALSFFLWKRNLHRKFPVFFVYSIVAATAQLCAYAADVIPVVSGDDFWRVLWVGVLVEALLKFAVFGELFVQIFGSYSAIANLGKFLLRGVGAMLVLVSVVIAAYTRTDSANWLISRAHVTEQSVYIVECGLLLFLFLLATHFRLSWTNQMFGIALGFAISGCVHLATWAIIANGGFQGARNLLDIVNMGAYHVCVLVWFYFLLIPEKVSAPRAVELPEHNLEIWNQELQRLLR